MRKIRLDSGLITNLDDLIGTGAGIWFQKQLEYIIPQVLQEKTPPRQGMLLFEADFSVPAGAMSYTQRMFTGMGLAKWIENYSEDLPQVGLAAKQETFYTKRFGVGYEWTLDELKAAQFTGMQLSTELGVEARKVIENWHDRTIWLGAEELGIHGVLTYPYTPHVVLAEPIGAGASTVGAMLDAILDFVGTVEHVTNTVAKATRLLLPSDAFRYLNTKRVNDTTMQTCMGWLNDSLPGVQIVNVAQLGNDFHGLGYDYCLVDAPGVFKYVVPGRELFLQESVVQKVLAFIVNCHAKNGGVRTNFPLEAAIGIIPA